MKTLYWHRFPGTFVNKNTGKLLSESLPKGMEGPKFTGSVREWYETLVETCIDLHNQTMPKGKKARLIVGASALTIFECSVLYRPTLNKIGFNQDGTHGTLTDRFDVVLDTSLDHLDVKLENQGRIIILGV
jgi:hypothetical protein